MYLVMNVITTVDPWEEWKHHFMCINIYKAFTDPGCSYLKSVGTYGQMLYPLVPHYLQKKKSN